MEEQTNEALWYVVHTYSGYENKVANDLQTMVENRHLQDLICDIKVPTEMVPEIKDGKERMVEHKLFPGYVLVKMVMNDDTWYVVRNTRGCTGFVGPASKPVPLSAEEVEKMGVEKAAPLTVDFNVGDTVQITAGPLEGFMGLVEGIDTETAEAGTIAMTDEDGNALTASDADGNAVECGVTDLGNGMESVTYGTVTEDPVNFSVADTLNTIVPKLVPLMLTLLLYYMFAKHSWTPTKGILLLFVLGILGAGPLGLWPSIW